MSFDYLKPEITHLNFRIKKDLLKKIDDIASFHHLSRTDWIRLQLERAVVKEIQLNKS